MGPRRFDTRFDKRIHCPINSPVQVLTHAIMNSEAVSALLAKTPSLKAAKPKLEAMEPGAFVVHRSWGFGQIKEYDESDMKLVIDFKGKKGHRMDPAFCVGSMDVLPAKHILARQQTEPAKVKALVEDDPVQLVIDTLSAYPNK